MYTRLKEIINNSYSIFSNYKVACIIEMKDGKTFSGVNIENPSFKDGMCAEQVAIGSAVSHGYKKGDFKKIYLLGSSDYSITPCFLCRQLLLEFFYENDELISYDNEGNNKTFKISELCPHAFTEREVNHD